MQGIERSTVATVSPKVVTIDEGEAIRPFGLDMNILLSAEESQGALSVIVASHKPGEGPPPHLHFEQEECFYVIEGEYELTVGDLSRRAGPGSLVFIPRNVPHTFRNVGTAVARMLDWSVPAGQDRYFRTVSEQQADGSFDAGNIKELSRTFDTAFPAA